MIIYHYLCHWTGLRPGLKRILQPNHPASNPAPLESAGGRGGSGVPAGEAPYIIITAKRGFCSPRWIPSYPTRAYPARGRRGFRGMAIGVGSPPRPWKSARWGSTTSARGRHFAPIACLWGPRAASERGKGTAASGGQN